LRRIGFQLPAEELDQLPEHLHDWEAKLKRTKQRCSSVEDMEQVFTEMNTLSDEDKQILFTYYNSCEDWNVQVQSGPMSTQASVIVKTRTASKKSSRIPYQLLDTCEKPQCEDLISLGKQSTEPSSFAHLFSSWASSTRQDVTSFDDFTKAYPLLHHATDFERFLLFASLYRADRWKVLFEMDNSKQTTRLRISLRDVDVDSTSFMAEYKQADKLRRLNMVSDEERVREWLTDSRFTIPMNYSLIKRKCVAQLPKSLSEWSGRLVDPKYSTRMFSTFKIVDMSTQVLRPEAQLLLYVYNGHYQEWEIVIHDELPSHQVSSLYAKSVGYEVSKETETSSGPVSGLAIDKGTSLMHPAFFATNRIMALPSIPSTVGDSEKDVDDNDDYDNIDLVQVKDSQFNLAKDTTAPASSFRRIPSVKVTDLDTGMGAKPTPRRVKSSKR
jgi:hypothetical protein